MKVLYIGQYQEGSTSRMRGEQLKKKLKPEFFTVVDTNIPFSKAARVFRSLGFRYKWGPLINSINAFIVEKLSEPNIFDLVWVDKGIFITQRTTQQLRKVAKCMVHYTPDPAFLFHQSKHFVASLPYYDFVVTTKSFEVAAYEAHVVKSKIILTTQGYDRNVHRPVVNFDDKKNGLVFIGHHEDAREELLSYLLTHHVHVALAGIKWEKFAKQQAHNQYLNYLGTGVYQHEYGKVLSSYRFGLGLLSKWIPEKHTTRTFEIPACGTALLTEKNDETAAIFQENEVIFFSSALELLTKIQSYEHNPQALKEITENGYNRVTEGGFDYESILSKILVKIGF